MSAAAISSMSPAKFLEAVRKGKHFEIVLLRGEEEYLLREALHAYVSKAVSPESADFNYCEFRSSEVSGETLTNALITLPFVGGIRLIVLDLEGGPPKDILKRLIAYSRRPSATTSLVMTYVGERRDWDWEDEKPASLVEVEFKPLSESDRMAWAEAYVTRGGKRLHPDAATYLVQTTSKSLSDLAAKLSHAILFVGDEPEISVHALMQVSGVSSEYTVFQLEDAILEQKAIEAHRIAKSLVEGGEALLRLLSFHRRQMFRLWQTARVIHKSGQSTAEIADSLRGVLDRQFFKANSFKAVAQRTEEAQLRRAVLGLLEVEVEAKTGTHDLHQYFEWLWRVCGHGWKPSEPAFQMLR